MGKFDDDGFAPGLTKERPKKPNGDGTHLSSLDFPVTWLQDAEINLDTRAIVKGLIEPGGFGLIYGPSGSGKSFFTADIAQCVATGRPWRGRKAQQGLVVYVAAEAGASILRRFVAWRQARVREAAEPIPLAIMTRGPNLLAPAQLEMLCLQLKELEKQAGLPLALVVFDTLSRSIPGGDENETKDMTMVVAAADRIRDEFKAATIYVHHSGKDPTKGARGSSALFAAADMVMQINEHCGTMEKVRDGVAGERFPFSLEVIELGYDADGDAVTTCLLNASDSVRPAERPEPTGKNQRIVLKELRALSPDGESSPGTSQIPKGVLLVRFEDLADRAIAKFAGMERAKARGRISDALSSLLASGYVGVLGELVWLA